MALNIWANKTAAELVAGLGEQARDAISNPNAPCGFWRHYGETVSRMAEDDLALCERLGSELWEAGRGEGAKGASLRAAGAVALLAVGMRRAEISGAPPEWADRWALEISGDIVYDGGVASEEIYVSTKGAPPPEAGDPDEPIHLALWLVGHGGAPRARPWPALEVAEDALARWMLPLLPSDDSLSMLARVAGSLCERVELGGSAAPAARQNAPRL